METATHETAAPAGGAAPLAPGPGRWASWRALIAWSRNRIAPIEALAPRHGGLFRLRAWPFEFHFVQDPDLVQEVLVGRHKAFKKDRFFVAFVKLILGEGLLTNEGPSHLRQRRMIQPSLHRDRVMGYGRVMAACAEETDQRWRDGREVNIVGEMMALTLDIVGKTLFSSDVRGDADRVAHAIETIIARGDIFLIPFFPALLRLPLPRNRAFHAAIATLDEVMYRVIEEHRRAGDRGDLLSMLLAAQDADDGGRMDDKQLRDEALTLFTAGHETTAIALTWTWYLLAKHPEIAARLHAEIDAVLDGRAPRPEDYPRLPYTQRVFREALRLYPPTLMVGREAAEDTPLGAWRVRRRAGVIITPYLVHRDPRWYPDPERFDPDRWLPERCEGLHKHAFIPFGGGQRLCIGEGFAWMEAVLIIATLARHWAPELPPGHRLELDPRLTMRPKGGLPMILRRRAG